MSKYILEITPAGCTTPFTKYGKPTHDTTLLTSDPDNVLLVVFTGGADVSPSFYGEPVGKHTSCHEQRDIYEKKMFELARSKDIPCVGICRGSQFMSVMAGGKLVQHITGHGEYHKIRTHDDRIVWVNSTHHQMQLPPDDVVILAVAEPKLSRCYLDGKNQPIKMDREIEAVFYPNTRSLGIQWHPEWNSCPKDGIAYAQQLTEEYLIKYNVERR